MTHICILRWSYGKGTVGRVASLTRPHFFICWITLDLGEFQSAACGEKIKIEPEPKLCKIIELLQASLLSNMLIKFKVNFGPKYKLYYDYHSKFLYKEEARKSFCIVLLTFAIILSFFFLNEGANILSIGLVFRVLLSL